MPNDRSATAIDQSAKLKESSPKPASDRAPPGARAAFRALRHRNFRLFFGGQLTSLIGTWMQQVAQAWLVLRLTNSSLMLGLVSFAAYLPILLVTLFAGVVVDRVDRRRLIVAAQTLLMLSAFVLAALSWTGVVRVRHVMALAALNGLVGAFDVPARQAFVVDMVGRDDLPNAIALNSLIFNGARVLGLAVAGLLVATIDVSGCFFLNGVSYLAVIMSLLAMDVPRREAEGLGGALLSRLGEGLGYAWRHRPTFYLLLLVAINSGVAMQYTVLMPVFARDLLRSGASGYGFLMAAQGLGAVTGALLLAYRSRPRQLRRNLVVGLFLAGLAIIVFGLSPWIALSLAAQTLAGAGLINHMATSNTMLQLFVSDDLRGRVMSLYTLAFIGFAPVGSLGVGYGGEYLSPRTAVVICGCFSLLCGVILLTRLRMLAVAQGAIETSRLADTA